MKNTLTLLLTWSLASCVTAQEFAVFKTDTTRFRHYYSRDSAELPKYITEQVWYFNGKKMFYGCNPIAIKVNPAKLDTILYKGYRRTEFDTIICNISESNSYTFFYNECCGAFNIKNDSTKQFIEGKIIYRLKGANKKIYLGTLGEAGILLNQNMNDTLSEDCRSAMSPNVYQVSLKEILPCRDERPCKDEICLQNDASEEPSWDYGFETVSIKLKMFYMPLNSEPINITYDGKLEKIEMDGILLKQK